MWWLALLALGLAAGGDTKPSSTLGLAGAQAMPTKSQILAYLRSRPDLKRVPIYKGFPQTLKIPQGFAPVQVWVYDDGTAYPDPRRFAQHHGIATLDDPERAEIQERFARLYWFGVSEGDALTFYVLGKPVANGHCCTRVTCESSTSSSSSSGPGQSSSSSSDQWMQTEIGGAAIDWERKLPPGWSCVCDETASECFTLAPALPTNWPRATEKELELTGSTWTP